MEALRAIAVDLVQDMRRMLDEDSVTADRIEYHISVLDRLLRGLMLVFRPNLDGNEILSMIASVQNVISSLEGAITQLDSSVSVGYSPPVLFVGERGRPKLDISRQMLEYFLDHRFAATRIAMLMHVSLSTVRRRMAEFGLSVQSRYSNMSDGELDRIVTTIMHQHPHCGYRMIQGFLASLGHRVQQNRVRDCLIRLDPEGVIARWNCTVHRRSYSVATPNALWHIDGNHRLIRYIAKKESI